jgi:DNA-binding IclR family transcriptional regulator
MLSLDRTVVYRLVKTLAAADLLVERSGMYSLGPRNVLYSNTYLDRLAIRRVVLPYAVELQTRMIKDNPWVTTVAIPIGSSVTIIDRVYSQKTPLDAITDIGTTFPIDHSAAGRCVLAFMETDAVIEMIGAERLTELTPVLDDIRAARGVDLSYGDAQPGIGAVAAAIFGRSGAVLGTFGVTGPNMDSVLARDSELAVTLRRAADSIGRTLAEG